MKKGKTPEKKKFSGRGRGRSRENRESNDSINSRGNGTSDFSSRREGTARDWDWQPRTPFGPNGASDI